jgi:hypothetical protein
MSVIYKILCEVKWMHEYYLTSDKGDTVFDLAAQSDRINFIFGQFVKDVPSINSDLEFVPPAAQQSLFDNLKLKIIPSYSGFKIAVRCSKKKLNDGTIVYLPLVPFPDNLVIPVLIQEKSSIAGFSNNKLIKPVKPAWYFTNNDIPAAKTLPFLSNAVPAFNNANLYEQGEIAAYAANDIRLFLNNGAVDPWLKLKGTGYINDSDNWALPLSFLYHFNSTDNITDALFILTDAANAEVKRLQITEASPITTVRLDFHTDNDAVKTFPGTDVSAASFYTLTVTGTNGYSKSFSPLLFAADDLNISGYAGIIHLKSKPANPAFNLLDNNGYLFTRILPNNTIQPGPVFELWLKSRLVYWQYSNNKQRKIKTTTDTQDVLADNGGVLVSKNPFSLTYTPVMVKKPDNSFQFLPNPVPGDDVKVSGNKYYINILVPESKMFPLA